MERLGDEFFSSPALSLNQDVHRAFPYLIDQTNDSFDFGTYAYDISQIQLASFDPVLQLVLRVVLALLFFERINQQSGLDGIGRMRSKSLEQLRVIGAKIALELIDRLADADDLFSNVLDRNG